MGTCSGHVLEISGKFLGIVLFGKRPANFRNKNIWGSHPPVTGYYRKFHGNFPEFSRNISRTFPEHFPDISRTSAGKFPDLFPEMSRNVPEHFPNNSRFFPGIVLHYKPRGQEEEG